MDHDPWVFCPYNKAHQVPLSRIQAHIVKCQKNYPPYHICPYNATHRLPEAEDMKQHIYECPSRPMEAIEKKQPLVGNTNRPKPILQREYLPETDPNHEMWD